MSKKKETTKPQQTAICFTTTPELKAKLKQKAQTDGRSLSNLITKLLNDLIK